MVDLAEVLRTQPVQRRAVQLGGAADVVVDLGLERLAVGVVPGVLGDVLAVDEHRLGVPVVHLPGQEVAPLEEQDPLARAGQRVGQRAAAGAAADDDDVVVLGHVRLRSSVLTPVPRRFVVRLSSPQSIRAASGSSTIALGPARAEEVPPPRHEGVDPLADAAHQPGVDAEPGGEGDVAVQLVVVGTHLGDGRAVADHRHDALVLVVEGLARLAVDVGEDVLGRPPAGLEGDRAELREVVAVVVGDVGHVADRVDAGEALRR